ncbi:hypothetical protein IFM89_011408 [Coptis chinensis]|uniref:inorganic diphosphatase n=1 Tax=Coptis chinensis TaxID=261450 RepID=A0A835HJC3_9MAGN|nr:hypothetical protein IFM89_011408 [Coptis chinensis]
MEPISLQIKMSQKELQKGNIEDALGKLQDIKELAPHCLAEIRRFIEDYKKNENKEVAVNDFLPAEDVVKAIKYSM